MEIVAPYASQPVAVTDFNNEIWQQCSPIRIEHYWSGEPAMTSRHAEARICWSNEALHVRFNGEQHEPLIVSENPEDNGYILSAVSQDGDFLIAYTPYGRKLKIKTDKIKSEKLKAFWFNPRDGKSITLGVFSNIKEMEFAPHSEGRGSDWLLVIEKN